MKLIKGLVTGRNLTFRSRSEKKVINYCLILKPESGTSLRKLELLAEELRNPKVDLIIIIPSQSGGFDLAGDMNCSNLS
jgi:hypothetical protein